MHHALFKRGLFLSLPLLFLGVAMICAELWREDWDRMRFFKPQDFECKCGMCGGAGPVSIDLVRKLEEIRVETDQPIVVTSGCRCEAHNREVGGAPNSAHLNKYGCCRAADIKVPDAAFRYLFVRAAVKRFKRIGIGPDFIHVDNDPELPKDAMWTYSGSAGKDK